MLVDVGLPGPSGMRLLEELRRGWPRTGAVVLSGLTELSVATDALERGALGYVVKPFRVRDLRIQVTAALAAVRRSSHIGLASARARVLAALDAFRGDRGERVACLVVDLECVPLLNASYGVEAIDRLCECVERRLGDFGSDIEVLGRLGPATFAAAFRVAPDRLVTETARALYRALGAPAFVDGQRMPISARLGVAVESIGEGSDSIVNLAEGAAVRLATAGTRSSSTTATSATLHGRSRSSWPTSRPRSSGRRCTSRTRHSTISSAAPASRSRRSRAGATRRRGTSHRRCSSRSPSAWT